MVFIICPDYAKHIHQSARAPALVVVDPAVEDYLDRASDSTAETTRMRRWR